MRGHPHGLKKVGADLFIYIGGNDTSGTQQILTDAPAARSPSCMRQKPIRQRSRGNDHTPGFISAAEFVAGAFLSVDLDFRALPGIYVGIVMGRHAGFLTAAAAAWQLDSDSGPHLVYVPERPFSAAGFIDDVRATLDRHKRCIVAVSEGVSTADARRWSKAWCRRTSSSATRMATSSCRAATCRPHSSARWPKACRASARGVDALGYMPRGYIGAISAVDAQDAFGRRCLRGCRRRGRPVARCGAAI